MKKGKITAALLSVVIVAAVFSGCGLFGPDQTSEQTTDEGKVSASESKKEELSQQNSKEEISKEENSKQESSKTESSQKGSNKSQADKTESSSDNNSGGFVDFSGDGEDLSLRDLYESSRYSETIENIKKQYASDDFDINYTVEGENKIIITAKLKKQIDASKHDKSEFIRYIDGMEAMAGTYIGILEGTTTTKNIVIVAKILNNDGTVLAEKQFDRQNTSDAVSGSQDLEDFAQSRTVAQLLSVIPGAIGDSEAKIIAGVRGENEFIITVKLSQDIPEGSEYMISQQLETLSEQKEQFRSQLAALSGRDDLSVTIRVCDRSGRVIE